MREMKHSKKLAFAVLAAVTAVGANVNPVDAASVVMDNTNVVQVLIMQLRMVAVIL